MYYTSKVSLAGNQTQSRSTYFGTRPQVAPSQQPGLRDRVKGKLHIKRHRSTQVQNRMVLTIWDWAWPPRYTKKTRLWFSSFSCVAVAEGCVESGTVFGGLKKGLFGVARRDECAYWSQQSLALGGYGYLRYTGP
ncbi:hypothetical protein OOU_Y34scaffold00624g78 [Pyricularia oryzae Y34]|uniref:Uncharacterized protein n=1 Tax=Pyricularia oryzae (strain Y34) TaxID=1143189 RepID=A0AA97PJJ4_PYRO3|nr:hypothetical protein OOU_Y34scaffold00624g78 [Pyricularia oryzae Y34]